jgi:Tol biopolymer transport system component
MKTVGVAVALLVLLQAGTGDARRAALVGADPAWSPDGSLIAFRTNLGDNTRFGDIYVMKPDGSGLRQVTNDPLGKGQPTWSPDSKQIAYDAFAYIDAIDVDGTNHRRLVANGSEARGACCPAWSRNGRKIAYVFSNADQGGRLWVMNADGSGKRRIAVPRAGTGYSFPTWSPDSKRIAFTFEVDPKPPNYGSSTGFIGMIRADGRGRISRIKAGRAPWAPDWSRTGRKIVYADDLGRRYRIEVLDLKTRKIRRLGPGSNPSWSPDGRRIVFMCGPRGVGGGICVMNADGSHLRQL